MRSTPIGLVAAVMAAVTLVACAAPKDGAERPGDAVSPVPPGVAELGPSPRPSPTAVPSAPTVGSGSFALASGGTSVVGTGKTLIRYRVELESGIAWGTTPAWTPRSFATAVDGILAAPLGWTRSAKAPVTNTAERINKASWSMRRVSGDDYDVRIRLATAATVDKECAAFGLKTEGQYSCRFSKTIMVNLGRWLNGAPGYPVDIKEYRATVINHEIGHFLGFDHMLCPGPGQLAPIMQTQTVDLGGCLPNAYPFSPEGAFVSGPWTGS